MKIYKCDRCSDTYDLNENDPLFMVIKYRADRHYDEMDLCPHCTFKLERFMKGVDLKS